MEPNFPGNSKMPRPTPKAPPAPEQAENEKRVEKAVVSGEVIRKKKPLGRRFVESFFSGEAPKSVVGYVAMQVLMPAFKDMVADAGREAIDRILFPSGQNTSRSRSSFRQGNSVVNYNRYSATNPAQPERASVSHHARTTQNFDELLFPTRLAAEQVLDEMFVLLEKYQAVSVGDFFDLANITPEYTDRKYGWTDLRGVVPVRRGGAFVLDLPRPELLK